MKLEKYRFDGSEKIDLKKIRYDFDEIKKKKIRARKADKKEHGRSCGIARPPLRRRPRGDFDLPPGFGRGRQGQRCEACFFQHQSARHRSAQL